MTKIHYIDKSSEHVIILQTHDAEKSYNELVIQSEMSLENIIPHAQIPTLTNEAKTLIIEASQDKNGIVMRLHTLGGTTIQTNEKQFAEQGNSRSEAAWSAAVDQLENHGLIEDRALKGEVFFMTHEGYKVADLLRQTV